MKVLKLSTNKGGGATIAANRQVEALNTIGCDVKHLFIDQCWEHQTNDLVEDGTSVFLKPNMPKYLKADLSFQNYLYENRTDISNTYMSIWSIETDFDDIIFQYIVESGFDVVHFHWASNLISSKLLRSLSEKDIPIVITCHDMNPFTGACHYDAGCGQYVNDCSNCKQLTSDPLELIPSSHQEKKRSLSQVKPDYIFPSDWLNSEYKKSAIGKLLGHGSSIVIRNCLDTDYFSPIEESDRLAIKESFNFTLDEIIIVSGAENNNEVRKGFNFFESAVTKISRLRFGQREELKIRFVAFGGGNHELTCPHPQVKYSHLGVLTEEQVRSLFRCADLLAFTSVEENFANIILESLMCGCPVLGFNIGGIPDIVKSDVNGLLVSDISAEAYSNALADILFSEKLGQLKQNTKKWHLQNHPQYSLRAIAKELLSFYQRKIERQ